MSRKAQEEMFGFILVVVLIIVIALIFMFFFLKPHEVKKEDLHVKNLLETMLSYTTECEEMIEYKDVRDVIKDCYNHDLCMINKTEKDSCSYLENLLSEILIQAETDLSKITIKPVTSYNFTASNLNTFLEISKGTCEGNKIGSEQFIALEEGSLTVRLSFCYI